MEYIIIIIAVLALLGLPLFIVFSSIAMLLFTISDIDISAVCIEIARIASMPALIMVPLFTFAGCIMAESGTPRRFINFSNALLGWIPGGLGIVCLIACAFFTAFTGASGVTIIAIGGLLLPAMLQEKYREKFTLGLLTTSGSLGLLFPPSLPIILYGTLSQTSIDKLFIAGMLPGALLILILGIFIYSYAVKSGIPRTRFEFKKLLTATKEIAWELPLPFIVSVGVYGGIISITEVATTIAFYVLIVEVFIYRDISITRDLPRIMKESMVLIGAVLIILASALGFTNFLIDQEVPKRIFEFAQQFVSSKWSFLILLNIFFLIMGAMLDIFSAVVVVPLICPVAKNYGIDPIHLGIIFLTNLEIGYSFPPAGLNLFIASLRFRRPITKLYMASLPFISIYIVILLIITYIPQLSLWVLKILGKY